MKNLNMNPQACLNQCLFGYMVNSMSRKIKNRVHIDFKSVINVKCTVYI